MAEKYDLSEQTAKARSADVKGFRSHKLLDAKGYAACPHTAVAYGVLEQVLGPDEIGLFLATAHPAKFPEVVEAATGKRPALPETLRDASERPLRSEALPNDLAALKAQLG